MPKTSLFLLLLLILPVLTGCGTSAKDVPDDAPAEVVYAEAEKSREAGELKVARDLYERVYDDYPTADEATEAGWLEAEMRFQLEEYKTARTAFQTFHETHPLYRLGELENRMYAIGEELWEDGRSGLLGLGIFPTAADGIATMEWIVENLRNGSRADDALMFLARARMDMREYADATVNLEELLTEYRQSEWVYEARFLLGQSLMLQNRGPDYDLLVLRQAKKVYERYVEILEGDEVRSTEYADRLAQAKEQIAEIERRLAEKNLLIADYYISVERYDSAKFYLDTAARLYPETDAAGTAKERLEEIESMPR
jgi:outer membrane protein assembly factor BamD (BamD/ComL family)